MIIDAIIGFFFWLVDLILSALPDITVPSWLDASGPIGQIFAYAGSMGAWFPAPLAVTVLTALVTTWGIAFGIKLIRLVVSFFTGGGGSAA